MGFYSERQRRSAKRRECQECGATIEAGARYSVSAFLDDCGEFQTNTFCLTCRSIADKATGAFGLEAWTLGELRAEVRHHIGVRDVEAWANEP